MAEKLPPYEEWKLENPGSSKEFYDQVKKNQELDFSLKSIVSIYTDIFKSAKSNYQTNKRRNELIEDNERKEDFPKYDTKLPEIKLTTKEADKIIKKVVSEDTPDLKDLVKTADIKLEAQENPKTSGFTNALIFATGGPLSVRDDSQPLSMAGFSACWCWCRRRCLCGCSGLCGCSCNGAGL